MTIKKGIPDFLKSLEKMKDIHIKKRLDYASSNNPFENFERSALLMEWFTNPADKVYISLIGTKLARLSTLLNSGKLPDNESVEDSFIDLANYVLLWKASYVNRE